MKELDWKISIIKTSNGYVTEQEVSLDDGTTMIERVVFEDSHNALGEDSLDSTENLLLRILEVFAATGNRHSKERLRIVREPGDKYEDSKKETKIDD